MADKGQDVMPPDPEEPPPEAMFGAILSDDEKTVMKMILENPHRVKNLNNGMSLLMIAANNGKLDMMKLLMEHGADINTTGRNHYTALVLAVEGKHDDCAELLIDLGAEITQNEEHRPFPHVLVAANLGKSLRQYIRKGHDVNIQEAGSTPLHYAIALNHKECIETLVDASETDLSITNNHQLNVFHVACQKNNTFAMEKILARDPAMIDSETNFNVTGLHFAALRGNVESGKFILGKSKATLNKKTFEDKTPLHQAAEVCSQPFIQLLIDNGADVNLTDMRGNTPLHSVFDPESKFQGPLKFMSTYYDGQQHLIEEYIETCILLLKAQADYKKKNDEGLTPMELCPVLEIRQGVEKYIKEMESA